MQDLTKFLSRIQTFNLKIIPLLTVNDLLANEMDNGKDSYWIGEESGHLEYSNIQSELRLLKDMALVNLLVLRNPELELVLFQLKKVQNRFQKFWTNYHFHLEEEVHEYPGDYILDINLPEIFLVNGLLGNRNDIIIAEDFVESLSDSVKLRERMLNELIFDVEQLLYPPHVLKLHDGSSPAPVNAAVSVHGVPQFTSGADIGFLEVLLPYFPEEQHPLLTTLIEGNTVPEQPLVFKGNGNQLADAFKQLFEANLIVGCKKNELEKWIAKHFVYRYKNANKEFTEGYLNGIISSDVKPCKSPILEVKKKEDRYVIVSSLRNKKNIKF